MQIKIPELSLVLLIGASGSGKSSFAKKHFKPTEILSSDYCRALISDNENDQSVTKEAFDVLHFIAAKRLAAGKLTVIDATNVQSEARKPLLALAREYHVLPAAIVFGPHKQQRGNLRRLLHYIKGEGFKHISIFDSVEKVEAAKIERARLSNNLKHERGPFDIIGDVHGCFDELIELLDKLGYQRGCNHPEGRKAVFLGDLVDRGPKTPDVLRLVMDMVAAGTAICVPGNHDIKLMRKLKGKNVKLTHGLAESLQQLEKNSPAFHQQILEFIDSLVSHYQLDGGKLVVAHAGMRENLQGRASGKVREFALYGETTGETDKFGLPVRYDWAGDYRGRAMVVYGHTPTPKAEWLNNTICIDTGCVFGGKLTALRYPEKELVSVPAKQSYYKSVKPFLPEEALAPTLSAVHDEILDMEDVIGKRIITTRLLGNVIIRENNAAAALEVMSRFTVNPKWLIYLPPTMSPSETSQLPEHPAQAFAYYRRSGIDKVICEEKHSGSRVVVIVCRDEGVVQKRFGIENEGIGMCYTRTGRRFFTDAALESAFLSRMNAALEKSHFWKDLKTDWVCLDCEFLPVNNINDLKVAPFHILATEGQVHTDKLHLWHLKRVAQICQYDAGIMIATPYKTVEVTDPESENEGIVWWQKLTKKGGEGLVIKPFQFMKKGRRGWVQPALKCRGREYTVPIERLRARARGLSTKRFLALREFALGIEGLERFVRKKGVRWVHECVFGVLALDRSPVDPRL